MQRREFFSWIGLGGLVSALPSAIAACSRQADTLTTQAPLQTDGFRAIGTLLDLDRQGQLLNQQITEAPVLVLRHPDDPQRLLAVNPRCTHKGCTVAWNPEDKTLLCPCHAAKFAPDGTVLQGPVREPLATYAVKVEQGTILIAAQGQSDPASSPSTVKNRAEAERFQSSEPEHETEQEAETEHDRRDN
jgi:cytochrome b6-f complex iron-sulfur subunit